MSKADSAKDQKAAPVPASVPQKNGNDLFYQMALEQLSPPVVTQYHTKGHFLVEQIRLNPKDEKRIQDLQEYLKNIESLINDDVKPSLIIETFLCHIEPLGHAIADRSTDALTIQFLNVLQRFIEKANVDVNIIFNLLDLKNSRKNHLFFIILTQRDEEVVIHYLKLLSILKNKGLSEDKLNTHLLYTNCVDLIANCGISKILYSFINNSFATHPKILEKFKIYVEEIKKIIYEHIKVALKDDPSQEEILNNALNAKHPLGIFFALSKSFIQELRDLEFSIKVKKMQTIKAAAIDKPKPTAHKAADHKSKLSYKAASLAASALGISADHLTLAMTGAAALNRHTLTQGHQHTLLGSISVSGGKSLNDEATDTTVVCSQRDDDDNHPSSPSA